MCGVAATVDTTGRGRARAWALPHLRHRGPDGADVHVDERRRAVLEHCRLAVIDPENPEAGQPFWDPSGRWAIAYNGEIFNFREVRAELEREGIRFRTSSDTEVVLLGYLARGDALLSQLRGMFAFVVWDAETGEVFAARDQLGVKPLYYFHEDGVFATASEVRTLLAHPSFAARIDPEAFVEYLAFGNNYGERTLVAGIRKLPPGHLLTLRDRRLEIREYWDALPPDGPPVEEPGAADELRELLDDAVGASLVSDVPVGLMLSGGTDSSAIAALAARRSRPGELTAYSVAFGLADDEAEVAARLAGDLGIRHRAIPLTVAEIRADFDGWLADVDYPSDNPTWLASSAIARAASDDGLKVLLSGDGGDELFGGYNRWMKYLRFHDQVWRRVPAGGRRLGGALGRRYATGLAGDIARRAAAGGELFVPSRPFHDDLLFRCLGPVGREAAARRPPETVVDEVRTRFRERHPDGDYLAWMGYLTLKTSLVEDYLQRLDKMGMRHGVEGRVPLLDPALARWAFRVPQELKIGRYRQKALFRAAVRPLLPSYIMDRPKQGFCPPVATWAEALLARRVTTAGSPLVEEGLLDAAALEHVRRAGARGSFAAWTLGMALAWTQRHAATRLRAA